jgi:HemY protein
MIKLLFRFGLLVVAAVIFTWLADRPGTVTIRWLGREVETSFVVGVAMALAIVIVLWFLWGLVRRLWRGPRAAGDYFRFRRNRKGYESLSRGIIAAGAGDAAAAHKHAAIAGNALSDEPLVNVLAAQAAQLKGDRKAVKRIFEEMTKEPETEALGLRGLFAEARQAGDLAAAKAHAERALKLNPRLAWASTAVLQLQTSAGDWAGAAATLVQQSRSGLVAAEESNRKQAALYAAQALALEDTQGSSALDLALRAHRLDPALVPAALVAGRVYAAQRSLKKAVRALQETWKLTPHPDLAEVMAHAQPGDGPEARFEKVRDLVGRTPGGVEGAYALARAAALAQRWDVARRALEPFLADRPQARVCALMADIEEAAGDNGRAREWLARAVRAPRDPMWVSDGVACPRWTPVSPVSGEIVACEWKVPYETPVIESVLPAPSATTTAIEPPKPQRTEADKPVERLPVPDDPGVGEEPASPETAARKSLAADS